MLKQCKSRYQKHKQKTPDLNFKTNTNIYTKIDLTLNYETKKFLEENNKKYLWSGIRQRVLRYDA